MSSKIELLDVVDLTEDVPEPGLRRGQVGTVVELLAPAIYEVEVRDNEGRTYALPVVPARQLIVLHKQPSEVP